MSIGARLDDTIVAAPASAAYKLVGRPLAAPATPDGNSHLSGYARIYIAAPRLNFIYMDRS